MSKSLKNKGKITYCNNPSDRTPFLHSSRTKGLILCGLFAALTAIGAFLKIPLPPPFVPLTLQTLFCILAGLLLGPSLGAVSQAAYVVLGLIGLPIFTQGGGLGYVFVPTFGYLLSFIVCAWLCGFLSSKVRRPTVRRLFPISFAGLIVVYIIGVSYMYLLKSLYLGQDVSLLKLIYAGAIVCLPGNLLSCWVACLLAVRLRPIVTR